MQTNENVTLCHKDSNKIYKIQRISKLFHINRPIHRQWWCREREPEHVMKTAYIEELRTCPEKHRVYHVTESFYLPSRFMLHNFEEIEWPSNLVHIFIRITKLFSDVLEVLNYDGFWESKKLSDENQRRFIDSDWLILIDSLISTKNENTVEGHG